jgi:hypothetical protein
MKHLHVCALCGYDHHEPKRHGWVTVPVPGSWPPKNLKLCSTCVSDWERRGCPDLTKEA